MISFLDTNILIRHLTGDPPEVADRATAYLAAAEELLLVDLVLAEVVHVLESVYEAPREQVAEAARSVLAFGPIRVRDEAILHRAVEVYELNRIDFAEAYLVANAEAYESASIVSFDQTIDRLQSVPRIEP